MVVLLLQIAGVQYILLLTPQHIRIYYTTSFRYPIQLYSVFLYLVNMLFTNEVKEQGEADTP